MSRSPSPALITPRRAFLGQLATAAVAVAGTACAPSLQARTQPTPSPSGSAPTPNASTAAAAAASRPARAKTVWDDSWSQRVAAGKHKAVFDSPELSEGIALWQAYLFRQGYNDALGVPDSDVVPVIVMRHAGVPMAFNAMLWEKYELGKMLKAKDPSTGRIATTNPYVRVDPNAKEPAFAEAATLEGLHKRGAILLACNLATMRMASRIATRTKQAPAAVRAEVVANLVPGTVLQPSGVYATLRAQEMGAVFMRG